MGMNTAVMILNDHLHEIAKDTRFGEKLASAIALANRNPYTYGFNILPPVHADGMQIVAIGGNQIHRIGLGNYRDSDVDLLRKLAHDLGYRIVKLPTKEKSNG